MRGFRDATDRRFVRSPSRLRKCTTTPCCRNHFCLPIPASAWRPISRPTSPAANSSARASSRAASRGVSATGSACASSRATQSGTCRSSGRGHPRPVPASAGAVGPAASFRACHHSIPLLMDCTICANQLRFGGGVWTSAWHSRNATDGPLPEAGSRPGRRWTAWDSRSRARLDAARDALPISNAVTRGGGEGAHMHDQSFSHGRPR